MLKRKNNKMALNVPSFLKALSKFNAHLLRDKKNGDCRNKVLVYKRHGHGGENSLFPRCVSKRNHVLSHSFVLVFSCLIHTLKIAGFLAI